MDHTVYDCVIVGAGAAGISAGRYLKDHSSKSFVIIEARDRIGGRIKTDYDTSDMPLELGAEFIHGDGAVTHTYCNLYHLNAIPVIRIKNLSWSSQGNPACYWKNSLDANVIEKLIAEYKKMPSTPFSNDMSYEQFFRSKGFSDEEIKIADILFAQTCCCPLSQLSCKDHIREEQCDKAGEGESRIKEGYGTLLKHLSNDLPIVLNAEINQVECTNEGVVLVYQNGRIKAKTAIITIPIGVLKLNKINFVPSLPASTIEAINSFQMLPATKLLYGFKERLWDENLTYMCHVGLPARWWTPSYSRNSSIQFIACYVTADNAKIVDELSEEEAVDTGMKTLVTLLGKSWEELKGKCVFTKRVSWSKEPLTCGGYASVPPHCEKARESLAEPVANRIYFAGEAVAYFSNPQTVHGAFDSGVHTAKLVIDNLNK